MLFVEQESFLNYLVHSRYPDSESEICLLLSFTDIKIYIYLCTLLCAYILLLLSCFGCSQYILLLSIIPSSFYANLQLPHSLEKVVRILVLQFENDPLFCSKTLTFQLKTTLFRDKTLNFQSKMTPLFCSTTLPVHPNEPPSSQ